MVPFFICLAFPPKLSCPSAGAPGTLLGSMMKPPPVTQQPPSSGGMQSSSISASLRHAPHFPACVPGAQVGSVWQVCCPAAMSSTHFIGASGEGGAGGVVGAGDVTGGASA